MSAENGKVYATPARTTAKLKRAAGAAGLTPILSTASTNGTNAILNKLSSLTPARDLTLGGRGGGFGGGAANKKVFTPNLNVVRNKNANVKTSKDTTSITRGGRGRGERGGRGGASRGRGAGNSALIQTTGVFSEGAGAINIRKTSSGGSSSFGRSTDDAPTTQMRRPTLIKSEHKQIDLKADAAHVRELLGDSDEDDFLDDKTDLEQIPIKLIEAKWKDIKSETKLETSNANDDDSALAMAQKLQSIHVQQQQQHQQRMLGAMQRYPQNVEEMLEMTQPQLFLLQLPDTLPCEDDDSPEQSPKMDTSIDASPTAYPNNSKNVHNSRSLNQMEEGQVGKLLRYKSGKMKLVFGDTYYDLDMGMETGFLQDVMSISTNREERSGNMINLGPIQAKLTATPDWEHLLQQQMSQDKA